MSDKLFDGYVWKARILVTVVVLLPVWVILPWFTATVGMQGNPWLRNTFVVAGLTALGSMLVRQLGLIAERKLKMEWGGFPTTAIMRWSDANRSTVWKERMHGLVHNKLGLILHDREQEELNHAEADQRIREAFDKIRTVIWGKKDLPSHTANVDYGFARNLYGCRWLWLSLTGVSCVFALVIPAWMKVPIPLFEFLALATLFILVPIVSWCVVKPQVSHCAFRYAEHAWEHLERM